MIKFDILHLYFLNFHDITLPGITFKENGNTTYNKDAKNALITYIGETALTISNDLKNVNSISNLKVESESMYMITFMTSDVTKLYKDFSKKGIKCTQPTYDMKKNALKIPCKTKFKYMTFKPLKNLNLIFCFREIDTSSDLLDYQKAMTPNSSKSDITGVKEIKIYGTFTKQDFEVLTQIFDTSYISEGEFSAEIYDNQTLTFITSETSKVEIQLEVRGKVFKGKEINILDSKNVSPLVILY